jgi:phosphatidylglycerophosphate synthase
MSTRRHWLTRANVLSLARLLLAPPLAAAILRGKPGAAALVFALAVATDLADGPLARRRGEVSPLGALVDHAADASFVAVGCAALAARGAVTPLLPALIAAAFAQYALGSDASGGGPRASALGRWNGIGYYAALGLPLARDALGLGWPGHGLVRGLGWGLVASTLLSMLGRLLARRAGALEEPRKSS